MFKTIFLCLTIGLFSTSIAHAKPLTVTQILEATCRVSVRGAKGSGTCYLHKDGKYYVFTNAHVVGNNSTGYVEFFKLGHKTKMLPATIVWKRHDERTPVDFAIMAVDARYFGKYPPRVIPLVQPNYVNKTGAYVASAGCGRGAWANGWEGIVVKNEGNRVIFHPPPVGGQSGSGLHVVVKIDDEYQTRMMGIVTWRIGPITVQTDATGYEKAKGAAVLIDTFYKLQKGAVLKLARVPDHYVEVAQGACTAPGGGFALGNDSKYYRMTFFVDGSYEAVVPKGIRVVQWNVQCPGGTCPPNYGGGDYFRPNPNPIIPRILPRPRQPVPPVPVPPTPVPPNQPAPDNNNPYGTLPEWSGDDDKTKEELEQLKKQLLNKDVEVEILNTEIAKLQVAETQLRKELLETISIIDGLHGEIKTIKAGSIAAQQSHKEQLEELSKQAATKQTTLDDLVKQIQTYQSSITELTNKANLLENNLAEKDNVIEEKDNVIVEQENSTIGFTTATGVGIGSAILPVILLFVWKWWKGGGRTKVKDQMDKVEDVIQEKLTPIIGEDFANQLRKELNDIETRLGDKVSKLLGGLQTGSTLKDAMKDITTELSSKVDKELDRVKDLLTVSTPVEPEPKPVPVILPASPVPVVPSVTTEDIKKMVDELKTEVVNIFEQRLTEKIPSSVTTIIDNSGLMEQRTVPVETEEAPILPVTPQGEEYMQQLFALKEKDGESVRQWAVFATLYREAVVQLRKGTLYCDGHTKLQGQARTADAIDNWVRKEFLKKLTIEDVKAKSTLYNEALLGVLYKDAIENLRNGQMDVLGAEATAGAIQSWVDKEFLRRMGIKL